MDTNKITIERIIMSGNGPKKMYCLRYDGKTLFNTEHGHNAWTKKKDAQLVIDAIKTKGIEYVEKTLNCKAV